MTGFVLMRKGKTMNDDLTSRQAVKDMIKNHKSDFSTEKDYRTARACVNAVPPAQPQIIRCKECRHRDKFGCCKYWVGLTMGMPTTATDDDDFCSHAERSKT